MDDLIGKPKVQQWEYKIVLIKFRKVFFGLFSYRSMDKISEEFNEIGLFGWELCSLNEGISGLKCVFKRPLP